MRLHEKVYERIKSEIGKRLEEEREKYWRRFRENPENFLDEIEKVYNQPSTPRSLFMKFFYKFLLSSSINNGILERQFSIVEEEFRKWISKEGNDITLPEILVGKLDEDIARKYPSFYRELRIYKKLESLSLRDEKEEINWIRDLKKIAEKYGEDCKKILRKLRISKPEKVLEVIKEENE